jgi:hypothetical protein
MAGNIFGGKSSGAKIKLAGKSCTVDVQGEGRERLLVRSTKKKKVPVEEVDGDDFKYFLLAGQSYSFTKVFLFNFVKI